ncbi:ligand-gated channel [Elstera litoralis]|uniref:Ligand-gated channel n=1 Tax=Elstera litoralis TaxID=552518 RepID=A0A0F3IWD5_9PROT|nr:ligand-gated channel [Elstera litoralis]
MGAFAQQAATPLPAPLPTIVVTATKRAIDPMDVDGMIETAAPEDAQARNLRSIADLDRLFPDINIRPRSGAIYSNMTVRGQSSPDFYNPSVQVYVDGRVQDQQTFGQLLPLDTETIELLYGPQGTLYGRGAIGGVLSLTTVRPNNELRLLGSAGYGTLDRDSAVKAAGPLVKDILYGDVALTYRQRLGEFEEMGSGDRQGDTHDRSGRLRLRYAPTGSPLDVMVSAQRSVQSSDEERFIPRQNFGSRTPVPVPSNYRLTVNSFGLDAAYDFGGTTLAAISGYQDRTLDRTIMGYYSPEDQKTFTQEIRLASDQRQKKPVDYVVGAFYQNLEFERRVPAARQVSRQEIDSYALFGEATWHVTDRFDITPGLRFDYEEVDARAVGTVALSGTDSFSAISPKLALGYKIAPNLRVYGLYSSGFKAGGFTRNVSPANIAFTYDPQKSHNFEVGAKGRFFAARLELSASAYYTRTDDYQLFVGMQPNQYLQNVGEVASKGIDLRATAYPTDSLRIVAGVGLNHSEFTRYDTKANPGVSLKGKKVPYAPSVTANLSADYRVPLGDGWGALIPRAGVSYVGKLYFDESNAAAQSQTGYALFDAGVTWEYSDALALTAYADNIADKTYAVYGFNGGAMGNLYQLGAGRMLGARLNVKF